MSADSIKAAASGETAPGTMSQAATTDSAIKAALAKLDPANDEHWTNDGKPAMAAVNALLPAHITRERLEEVAPDFSRPQPSDAAPAAGEVRGNGVGVGAVDVDAAPQQGVTAAAGGSSESFESFEAHVLRRLDALEADQAYLRKTFGWPTKDA